MAATGLINGLILESLIGHDLPRTRSEHDLYGSFSRRLTPVYFGLQMQITRY